MMIKIKSCIRIISIVFFIFFLKSNPVYSCPSSLITAKLESMGYPSGLKNHNDLLVFIEYEFGEKAVELLKNDHTFLNASGRIDLTTLQWLEKMIEKHPFIFSKYLYIIESKSIYSGYLQSLIKNFKYGNSTIIPVFRNDSHKQNFITVFNKKEEIIPLIKNQHQLTDEEAESVYEKISTFYITKERYLSTLRAILPINETPIIHISGFKNMLETGAVDFDGNLINPLRLSNELLDLAIPKKATFKFDVCLFGCQTYPIKLKESEVITSIQEYKTNFLMENMESLFLMNLRDFFKKSHPLFVGKFTGYLGEKRNFHDHFLFFDGRHGEGISSELYTLDGSVKLDTDALFTTSEKLPFYDVVESDLQTHIPFTEMTIFNKINEDTYQDAKLNGRDKKLADGLYIFIVPYGYPNIILAKNISSGAVGGVGHTSLSKGKRVHFAGEATFVNGILVSWSNGSGHYKVPASAINHLPQLLNNFPKSKFESFG